VKNYFYSLLDARYRQLISRDALTKGRKNEAIEENSPRATITGERKDEQFLFTRPSPCSTGGVVIAGSSPRHLLEADSRSDSDLGRNGTPAVFDGDRNGLE